MSSGKRDLDDEQTLFREQMADATRHLHDRTEPFRPGLEPVPRATPDQASGEREDEGFLDLNIQTGDELIFVRPGVQKRLFQNLRRGQVPPAETLDLHGLRVAEARGELAGFLGFARRRQWRVVRIIHGKGYSAEGRQPILKQKVNQWLRQRAEVLAFCSAPRFDGGLGAVYVLLSRKAGRSD